MVQKNKKIKSECFSMKAEYNSVFFFFLLQCMLYLKQVTLILD